MSLSISEITIKIAALQSLEELEQIRLQELGKQGRISLLMKELGKLDPEDRKTQGQILNQAREQVASALEDQKRILERAALSQRLIQETLDITLPVNYGSLGRVHPVTQTIDEVIGFFGRLGFSLREGPEIETEYNNFSALNIPDHHPARQEMDTFYLTHEGERKVLRTHTSPVQIRTMLKEKPPLRILAAGRVYRSDWDQTHTPMFHQVEGLLVDKDTHFGHLKGCIIEFCRSFFDIKDLPVRFRPSYFPFTEVSAEVDIGYTRHQGTLTLGHGKTGQHGWLEVLGCGMVHPNVLNNCEIDPSEFQGFAFGMGVERFAMLKYGIPDLRTFFESDSRWLAHYGFSPFFRNS